MLSLKNIFLKFINNILFFLSGTVFVSFTFLVTGKISSVILAILLLLIYSCIRDCSLKEYKTIINSNIFISAFIICMTAAKYFFDIFIFSSLMNKLASMFNLTIDMFLTIFVCIGCIMSIYFVSFIISLIKKYYGEDFVNAFQSVSNRIKSYSNFKLTILILFLINIFALSALLRANIPYNDDIVRIANGLPAWENFSRYLSSILSTLLNTNSYLMDISPFTQILAALLISMAELIVLVIFVDNNKFTIWNIIAVLPLGISPYFLECFSYKFDSPFMALSVLSSLIPLLFINTKNKIYISMIFMGTLISCLTYQVSLGIFPMCIAFLAYFNFLKQMSFKDNCNFVLKSALPYIVAILFFNIFYVTKPDEKYVDTSILPPSQFIQGVLRNIYNYFTTIIQDFEFRWLICILIILILFIIMIRKKYHSNMTIITSIIVLVVTACLSYGVYMCFQKPMLAPRGLYGIGVWIAIVAVIISQEKFVLSRISFTYLSYCFFIFSLLFGNALNEQYKYVDFRVKVLINDLNDLEMFTENKTIHIKFLGDVEHVDIIEKSPQYNKVLKKLINNVLFAYNGLHGILLIENFYDIKNIIVDSSLDENNYQNVLLDSYYHTIKGDDKHLIIYLKDY